MLAQPDRGIAQTTPPVDQSSTQQQQDSSVKRDGAPAEEVGPELQGEPYSKDPETIKKNQDEDNLPLQQQEMTPIKMEKPSLMERTMVFKQKMFHPHTTLPEPVQQAVKSLSILKTKLQHAQKNLDQSIKTASSVQKSVDAYQKNTNQQNDLEMSKALQNMNTSVTVGSKITLFKDSLKKVKAVEQDISSLKYHRNSMDRYHRKSLNHSQGGGSNKNIKTQNKLSQETQQYEGFVQKIVQEVQNLTETTETRHQFEHDILSSEFQVLHSLRVCLSKEHTPEGEKLYHKAWKSFSKRMKKLK